MPQRRLPGGFGRCGRQKNVPWAILFMANMAFFFQNSQ